MRSLLLTFTSISLAFLLIMCPYRQLKKENQYYKETFRAVGIGGFSGVLEDEEKLNNIEAFIERYTLDKYKMRFDIGWPVVNPSEAYIWRGDCEFVRRRNYMHTGVDIVSPYNYEVLAVGDGTVDSIGYSAAYGNWIKIKLSRTKRVFYAHLSKIYVTRGQGVKKGRRVALIGNTGDPRWCKGYHLHWGIEVLVKGKWVWYNPFVNSLHKQRVIEKY